MIIHGDAKVMAAFVAARGEIGATVKKDARGNYGQYATLAALTEATTEPLAKHGCAIVQEASLNDDGVLVETWLIHESGGMLQFTPLPMPVKDRTAQSVGSAITYARRFALAAVCGIAPADDDGEAATHGKQPVKAQQPAATQKTQQRPATQATGQTEQAARETASPAQLKRLHTSGKALYGEAWEEERHRLVQAVSKGAVESSNDLSPAEAAKLIDGIEGKLAAQAETKLNGETPADRGALPLASTAASKRMAARIQNGN